MEFHRGRLIDHVHVRVTLPFEHAAAVPTSGFNALQGLLGEGRLQPGQKVLINGREVPWADEEFFDELSGGRFEREAGEE